MATNRILVVEDEGIVALDIQSKLESMGYSVPAIASTAEDAISLAATHKPDLILMDIQLGGPMDGVDAARRIHADQGTPVVYLTAYSDEHTLERAKSAQPFGYLLKPFEERELYTTVEVALYKHAAETERATLEEQLRQSQKMEAIGQLTAGVAHHFNMMLQGIVGNLDLAADDAPDSLRPFLEDASYDADRAARLVRQLMMFYRQEQSDHAAVDLKALMSEVTSMCRGIFPRSIHIELDLPEQLPLVAGNHGQLRQCLTNLCANSRDAVTVKGAQEARIILRATPLHIENQGRDVVRVDVVDDGIGMDEETRERIFEPLFTTKQSGSPAGLGLASTYGILRDHGGWIECDSTAGKGTTMSLFLPTQIDEAAAPPARVPVTEATALSSTADLRPFRGDESVLVIADDDRFRKILDLMLERSGYVVHLGRDSADGVNLFRHERPDIDLVLIALSRPATAASIEELLRQLRAIDSKVRTLVVTPRPDAAQRWGDASAVLLQPFNTFQLLKTARSVLDA